MNRSSLRRTAAIAALAAAVALGIACTASADAVVGEQAPGFTLKALDGHPHSLADSRGKVVVLEWINPNCPYSRRHAHEKTMIHLHDQHPDVVWLAINSTNPSHGDHLTPAEHEAYDQKYGIDYPVLVDPTGDVAHAYGAKATPHMFVIDETGTLIYDGAIDDDPYGRKDPAERTNYVAQALAAHAAGRPVEPATTKPYGCSIKY